MNALIILGIIALSQSSLTQKKYLEQLKKIAPFQVADYEDYVFKDKTPEELKGMHRTRLVSIEDLPKNIKINDDTNLQGTPATFDFRVKHPECVAQIRDQGDCGGCWSFAMVSAFQSRHCLETSKNIKFSAQDPISCDSEDEACEGGTLFNCWNYLYKKGVVTDSCFPYTSGKKVVPDCISKCKNSSEEFKKYESDTFQVFKSQSAIKKEVSKYGPVETQMTVYKSLYAYKGGIYQPLGGEEDDGGHAVAIIGYGSEDGINYWICQNSWGENWGEKGFFRIKMGTCGIDELAVAHSGYLKSSILLVFLLLFTFIL